jgi:hypothetical protein
VFKVCTLDFDKVADESVSIQVIYSAFDVSVQECDTTDNWPLMAGHRGQINNKRLAASAGVFALSGQWPVVSRQ